MADQNLQDPNLPAEDPDTQIIEKLQKEAFYSLLFAFSAENFTFSHLETSIVERLMKEWKISQETLIDNVKNIQKDLVAQEQQQRVDASVSKPEIVEKTESGEKATLNPTSVAINGSKWGKVDPETLVGTYVRLRTETKKGEFIIKEYDSNQERHRVELADLDPDTMEIDDELSWIDVTRIPHDDIEWERGIRPNFGGPNQRSRNHFF